MRKQLAMGAGIALAVGAVALGCSSSSSHGGGVFVPSSVDLNNGDNAPMSAIATNNLSADGGGFSGSYQNFVELQMKINKKPSTTDGVATSADGSAVVAFQTADQLDGHFRLYMSYFDGSAFTPPIEVTGHDRDEYVNAGGATPDIHTSSILMIPVNTSGYQGAANSTTGDAGAVRGNSGNWVIVWDATTYTTAPNQKLPTTVTTGTLGGAPNPNSQGTNGSGIGNAIGNGAAQSGGVNLTSFLADMRIAQNLQGAHRALYETLFVKSLKGTPSAFSQILGTNTAVAGTSTQPSREYRYGFLVEAVEITTLQRGAENGFNSTDISNAEAAVLAHNNASDTGSINSPAESVQSYGFASDGLSGCAVFTGGAQPFSTTVTNGFDATVDQPHDILGITTAGSGAPGKILAEVSTGTPGPASYTIGEDVTFVRLYFTQVVSSANSGDTAAAATPTLNGHDMGVNVGDRLGAFTCGLDLRTLQFDAPVELTLGTLSTEGAQPLKAAQSPLASFATYNQYLFINFVDASIAQTSTTLPGDNTLSANGNAQAFVAQNSSVTEWNLALLAFTVTNNQAGGNTLGTAPTRISVLASTTTLATANLKQDNLSADSSTVGNFGTFDTWTFGNQDQAFLVGGESCGCPIFGQDEGLDDTTVFFVEKHSSAGAVSTDTNIDAELCAAVLDPTGALQASGKNPVVLSQHVGENTDTINASVAGGGQTVINQVGNPNQGVLGLNPSPTPVSTGGLVFQDPVEGLDYAINRNGTYVIVTYRQWIGTSSGSFQKGLNAVVMQTFRVPNSNGTTGTTPLTTASPVPAVDARFATGNTTAPSGVTALQPTGNNVAAAFRIDIPGTTGVAISGQPGTPAAANPQGVTQLSSGFVNDAYVPNNPFNGGFAAARFPTTTGVNFQQTFPCGYRCSFQSDVTLSNIMWEQGDTSEDRVYVRQIKVVVSTTGATPTVTLGSTAGNLESGAAVKGDALFNIDAFGQPTGSAVRSTYQFLPGDAQLGKSILAGDLGVDSTGKGGGLLIVYAKTTNGSATGSTGFNRAIFAVTWDGAQLGTPVQIDRGSTFSENTLGTSTPAAAFPVGGAILAGGQFSLPGSNAYIPPHGTVYSNNGFTPNNVPAVNGENNVNANTPNGNGANGAVLHTNLFALTQVSKNNDISGHPALSPTETAIFFVQPTGDDGNSSIGLWERAYNHQIRTQANTTTAFGDQFVPVAGTSDFAPPQRLDHMTGGDVLSGPAFLNSVGTEVTVIFRQDGHYWLSGSNDPINQPFTNDGKGSADPFLVDNDTSASVTWAAEAQWDDSSCGNLHKTVFFFSKNDLSQTNSNSATTGPNNTGSHVTSGPAIRLRLRQFN